MKEEIKETVLEVLPGAEVQVLNPRGDDVHLEAIVVAEQFRGKTLINQHKMVMNPLKEHFHTSLHALGLKTFTPEEWAERKGE